LLWLYILITTEALLSPSTEILLSALVKLTIDIISGNYSCPHIHVKPFWVKYLMSLLRCDGK